MRTLLHSSGGSGGRAATSHPQQGVMMGNGGMLNSMIDALELALY